MVRLRHKSVLDSPSVGTSASDLIEPCRAPQPHWKDPEPPSSGPPIAVALSGGGFRATLSGLGVLRFLVDSGLINNLRYSSSVSGGSVANGLLANSWDTLRAANFSRDKFDELVVNPFVESISKRSLSKKLLLNAWRAIGPKTRTGILADSFDDWFFHGTALEDIPQECRFIINSANLTTGVRFGFERDVMGDYVLGNISTSGTRFRLSRAVAASAAVPGAFSPMKLKFDFPCADGRTTALVDGGVYDNSGLEAVDRLGSEVCLVALNAGGLFHTGNYGWMPVVKVLSRVNAILYRQSTAIRRRTMVERFMAWEAARDKNLEPPPWGRCGVLFGLATSMTATDEWLSGRPEVPPWLGSGMEPEHWRTSIASIGTSFNKFNRDICRQLIYRGWWLAGANLAKFHRSLLPEDLPAWGDQ